MWKLDHKEGWALKIWCFKLLCWRRLLRVRCTARRSNQLIPKKISPEYSLEGLMLNLKLQYFGYLMWRTDSLEKFLMLGETEGRRRRGQQTNSMDMSLSKLHEIVKGRKVWRAAVHEVTKSWTWLSNWTTATSFPRSLRLPNKLLQALDWGIFLGAHPMLTCCHPPSADTPNCL